MLSRPTVFVIGAGASCEFELPDGTRLADRIANSVNIRWNGTHLKSGDLQIAGLLRTQARQDDLQKAGWRISAGLPGLGDSIDSFLDNHRSDEHMQLIGRIAIIKEILSAEGASPLVYDGRRPDPTAFLAKQRDTWIGHLFRTLQRRRPREEIEQFFEGCTMVVFNYDRCIEHFFEHAIARYYSVDQALAQKIVSKAAIFHVYGSVGLLPGHNGASSETVEFGDVAVDLVGLTKRISTYTEQRQDETLIEPVRKAMAEAGTIVFLGFGYHAQNLDLVATARGGNPRIIGTARGVSDYNMNWIKRDLMTRFNRPHASTEIHDLTCGELMRNFSGAWERE